MNLTFLLRCHPVNHQPGCEELTNHFLRRRPGLVRTSPGPSLLPTRLIPAYRAILIVQSTGTMSSVGWGTPFELGRLRQPLLGVRAEAAGLLCPPRRMLR